MAHFIGYLQGNRGETSRLGSKSSGIRVQAQGWHIGARIFINYNEARKKNEVYIYKTGGTKHPEREELIAEFTED